MSEKETQKSDTSRRPVSGSLLPEARRIRADFDTEHEDDFDIEVVDQHVTAERVARLVGAGLRKDLVSPVAAERRGSITPPLKWDPPKNGNN